MGRRRRLGRIRRNRGQLSPSNILIHNYSRINRAIPEQVLFPSCKGHSNASSMSGSTKRGLHRMKSDEIPSPKIQSNLPSPPRSYDASHICPQEYLCRRQPARKRFPVTEFLENRRLLRLCSSICGREQHQLHGDPESACVHLHHIHQRGRLPAILRGSPERDPQQHERHDPYPDSLRTLQDPAGQGRDNCFLFPLACGLHREWYLHYIPQLSRPKRHGLRVVQPRIPSLGLWDSPGSYLRC